MPILKKSGSLDSTQNENGISFIGEMRQWRKPRTKVRPLITKTVMPLGVRVQVAVGYGIASKGPWRSSKAPGILLLIEAGIIKYLFKKLRDYIRCAMDTF
jgi:hypothetical protein